MDRRARLLGPIDYANCVGVEIGALHSPTVSRTDGRVIYVDYMPTALLRANLRHPGVLPADVLEVDVVWGDYPLREALGETVDFVVACHVIEHVPDVMGWLLEIHAALRPGGILGLAIPDRRATFDVYRADSGIAEVVAAYVEGRRRPSLQQIFDAGSFSAATQDAAGWRLEHGSGRLPAGVVQELPKFYGWLRNDPTLRQRYVDVHCWVFTPASFLVLAEALHAIGCFPYVIEAFYPTEAGAIEFQVRLRAVAAGSSEIGPAIGRAWAGLPSGEVRGAQAARLELLAAENMRLAQELAAMRAARCWRMTAPVRALAVWLRRARGFAGVDRAIGARGPAIRGG